MKRRIIITFSVCLAMMATSCNVLLPADTEPNGNTIQWELSIGWGASKETVIKQAGAFAEVEESGDFVNAVIPDDDVSIVYQFINDELCASIVAFEDNKYRAESVFDTPLYLGDIGTLSVFAQKQKNTLVFSNQLNFLAFIPIESDYFETLNAISITTGSATDVTSNSAVVSGMVEGYSESCVTGIAYGDSSSSLQTSGIKVTATPHDSFTVKLTKLTDGKTYYYSAYVEEGDDVYYGEVRSFSTPKATAGELQGHGWVDLGLPSGLKWATTNVDATEDTEYGGWYAWGMVRTTNTYGVSFYDYYNSTTIPSNISGTTYDVATTKWGSDWRMPTFSEMKELAMYCSFKWENKSGTYGALLTGPNGNTIFLPAAGGIGPMYLSTSAVQHAGESGVYWSATMAYRQNGNMAKYFSFSSSGISLTTTFLGSTNDSYTNCFNGMQIRPVTD